MSKEIVPHKMVVSYNPDGTVRDSIMMYRIKENGVTSREYKTVNVKVKIDTDLEAATVFAKEHVELSEKIITEEEVTRPIEIKPVKENDNEVKK